MTNHIPVLPLSPPWPLQLGQPLREKKYSQQHCKCNRRQLGSEPKIPDNTQMH